jgi:scyllo-inositol 2-dehydrogenase (NADP+)
MNTSIKTGILSFGMSGKVFHAPFIHTHSGFTLTAIVERTKKQAHLYYPNVTSYNSIEELINDSDIELVIINTPNFTHFEYAEQALMAGKHVLVEKPFTATTSEAKQLFELAKKVNKKVLFYHNRRFDSGFNAVKKVIESGCLGKLVEVHFRYDRYRNEIGPKYFKEELLPATGLQYDLGPHLIDQAICLFGRPLKFQKVLAKHRENTKVDDYFSIQLSYPNDLNVFLTASMLVVDIREAFVLNGTLGSFTKNHADVQEAQLLNNMSPIDPKYGIEDPKDAGKLTTITADGNREVEIIPSDKGDYTGLFDAVYQTIIHNAPYFVTEDDILCQLAILESKGS